MFRKPRFDKMILVLQSLIFALSIFSASVYAQDENTVVSKLEFMDVKPVYNVEFMDVEPVYNVGQTVTVDLVENLQVSNRFNRVDLWIAIQIPKSAADTMQLSEGENLLFKTPFALMPFSLIPQPFRLSLEAADITHRVLEFEVLPGFKGDYTFYAAYVQEGTNPITDSFIVLKSEIAEVTTVLSNY